MTLQELHAQAIEIMESFDFNCGIYDYEVKAFKSKTNFGDVSLLNKVIRINQVTIEHEQGKALNTLIHELLHVHCYHKYGCTGHTGQWKRLAQYISANSEYNITRTASASEFCAEVQDNFKTSTSEYKYAIVCEECGATTKRKKKVELVKLLEENKAHWYHCGRCGCTKLKLEML